MLTTPPSPAISDCWLPARRRPATPKNIELRPLRRNQPGGDGGAVVGVGLNGGTYNVNGGHSPADEPAGTGAHT